MLKVLRHEKQNGVYMLYPIQMYIRLSSCQLIATELLYVTAKQDAVRSGGHVSHVERKLSPGASW